MKFWWYALLSALLAGCSSSESDRIFPAPETVPSIQLADVDQTTVPFGQPVELNLRITSDTPVKGLTPQSWLDPAVTLLEERLEEPVMDEVWQQDLSLKVAVYAVTNTPVFVSTPLTQHPELTPPFLSLEVTSRLTEGENDVPTFGKDEQPDFRGPEALKRRKRNILISIVALTILVTAMFLGIWFHTHKERPAPPQVPPHVAAFKRLEDLKQAAMWLEKDVEATTVELSLILREYIEGRFGIQAPDLTTEEFLIQVEADAPWSEQQQTGLKAFFDAADRIKYAGDRPAGGILEELYTSVSDFVTSTREQAE